MFLLLLLINDLSAYNFPRAKQGICDSFNNFSTTVFSARYRTFTELQSGLKIYNVFWSDFESSGIPSSMEQYATCPTNYIQVPSNQDELLKAGYHRFRCVENATMMGFDNLFQRDQAAGIQSMSVIWSSPSIYRNQGCHGFQNYPIIDTRGCVPSNASLDDFKDYINFLASRYNGMNGYGHLQNFII